MQVNLASRLRGAAVSVARVRPLAWAEALLMAALVVAGVVLFWTIVAPVGPVGRWPGTTAKLDADSAVLTRFDPFFRTAGGGGPSTVTSLPLQLFGTRSDEAMGRGSAIIATPDGLQASYAVGDAIMPGIFLKGVAFDHVTIERGGVAETLYLDQSVAAPVVQPTGASPVARPAPPPASATITPQAMRSDIGYAPRMEKGRMTGLVVTPQGSGGAFSAIGLQPGDVVTLINGLGFNNADEAAEAVANPPAGGRMTFTVERGGKPIVLTAQAAQ